MGRLIILEREDPLGHYTLYATFVEYKDIHHAQIDNNYYVGINPARDVRDTLMIFNDYKENFEIDKYICEHQEEFIELFNKAKVKAML